MFEKIYNILSSKKSRIVIVILGFIFLIILRQIVKAFGVSLGYLYVFVISITGFWFGVRGGIIAAIVSCLIFIAEINILKDWPGRDVVIKGITIRFFIYFLEGIMMGLLYDIEKKLVIERKVKEKLKTLAFYDELTGCVNFRWAMQIMGSEIARSKRYNNEMAVAMLDIDYFKKINDNYGHLAGNDVLKNFSDLIKQNVRNVDTVSRYGGDEFLVILPQANCDQPLVLLERIKNKLSEHKLTSAYIKKGIEIPIEFSGGVACYPNSGSTTEELLKVADNALYRAKNSGRNGIVYEKRKWKRTKHLPGLKIELVDPHKNKNVDFKMADISQEGMLLLFPDGTTRNDFLCKMYFSTSNLLSEFKCKVMHEKQIDENLYSVGVYFVDIPTDAQKELINQINNSQNSDKIPLINSL